MSSKRPRGLLVVLSGPSGSGKTTVGGQLVKRKGLSRVVTATSRPPRGNEKNGRDYLFLEDAEFKRRVKSGAFLEHVTTLGRYYGTPRSDVEEITGGGDWALCIIDVKGAAKIRESGYEAIFIFLEPPSYEELEKRLRGRGTESPWAVKKRLALARREMREKDKYDHSVVNDTVTGAVRGVLKTLRSRGWSG